MNSSEPASTRALQDIGKSSPAQPHPREWRTRIPVTTFIFIIQRHLGVIRLCRDAILLPKKATLSGPFSIYLKGSVIMASAEQIAANRANGIGDRKT
jgi:hypothetical protein